MANVLAAVAKWGPSVYYALGASDLLSIPYQIKSRMNPIPEVCLAQNWLPDLFQKVNGLRGDIYVLPKDIKPITEMPFAAALGMNFGPTAFLFLEKEIATVDPEATHCILKHEVAHIKHNDSIISSCLAALASLVSGFAVPLIKTLLPVWFSLAAYAIPFLVAVNVFSGVWAIGEFRADDFAFKNSTDAELFGMQRFLKACIEVNQSFHKKHPYHFQENGNFSPLRDPTHPPLSYRIKQIHKELERRNVVIPQETEADREKINKLKEIALKEYKKIGYE
jgi:Zn-dependent protease with chaperone function